MTRYAIIRQSTDLKSPNTRIRFVSSKKLVREALNEEKKLSFSNPEAAKNWHHDLSYIYEIPFNWRKPREKYLTEKSEKTRGGCYPRNREDILAHEISKVGREIKSEKEI